jgi:hypothetical protein
MDEHDVGIRLKVRNNHKAYIITNLRINSSTQQRKRMKHKRELCTKVVYATNITTVETKQP